MTEWSTLDLLKGRRILKSESDLPDFERSQVESIKCQASEANTQRKEELDGSVCGYLDHQTRFSVSEGDL